MPDDKEDKISELARFFFEQGRSKHSESSEGFDKKLAEKAEDLGIVDDLLREFTLRDLITYHVINGKEIDYWQSKYNSEEES